MKVNLKHLTKVLDKKGLGEISALLTGLTTDNVDAMFLIIETSLMLDVSDVDKLEKLTEQDCDSILKKFKTERTQIFEFIDKYVESTERIKGMVKPDHTEAWMKVVVASVMFVAISAMVCGAMCYKNELGDGLTATIVTLLVNTLFPIIYGFFGFGGSNAMFRSKTHIPKVPNNTGRNYGGYRNDF